MSEYGQLVGNGTGAGGGHAVGTGAQSGDVMSPLSGLVDSASTAAGGLPAPVLALVVVFAALVLLVFLRRVFG